jgi:zinc protease
MQRTLLSAALAFVAAAPLLAQTPVPLTQALPVDPKVTIGTLPNGIRYYIRQNAKPEKRAELRLVVNAGSVLEDDDQLGLAHFLEHTAFNGTTHFKKNELVNYLESIGVRFGADLNAYTGFDETVYILPIPTDTQRLVNQAFQILEDWAHGQLFDPTEVTNERGVVQEEWRGRKGAGDRMLQKWLPIALKGSRYATRLPIGTQESILSATPDRLRRFYQDWYRPDLMAVVAVGDFDKTQIEQLIKQHFSGIAKRSNARPRVAIDVPDNVAPLVAVATDKEATSSNFNVTFKLPHQETKTVGDYRRDLTARLYLDMLNSRFSEISQKPDAPFLAAGGSTGSFFARGKDAFTLGANVKDGAIEQGLQAVLLEARRADQFGFLESELGRAKQNMLRGYERAYTERDKTQSGSLVSEYVGNYLYGEAIPGIEYEYQLVQQLLPGITLADVNTLGSKWITDENRIILVQAPEKEGVKVPTESELLAIFGKANQMALTAWTENLAEAPLVEKLPAGGKVVSEKSYAAVGVTEWKLSNGARVLVKPTDFKADEILFTAYSPGGTSLVSDADYMSAALASQIMSISGVGNFNRIDLGKKLTGKVARVAAGLGSTSETLGGTASPKDLETLLQLVYLQFTAPRVDTVAFGALKNQAAAMLANRGSSPEAVFGDTVTVTLSQHHFRARPLTLATFNEVNPVKSLEVFKDRFAEAGDFTFMFVGNVDLATLKPLAERYLATLPTTGRKETFKAIMPGAPRGVVEKVVRKGTEPKANTLMFFTGACKYTPEDRFAMRALTEYFQIKLNETLREQLGGTYSPDVRGGCSRTPRAEYSISVQFGSSPENVDKLSQTVLAMIDSLKAKGPSAADVDKVREQITRSVEVDRKTNAYWQNNLAARDQAGEDLAGLLGAYDQMVKSLTPAQIQQAAKLYFDTKNYLRFVLLPETKPTS